MLPITFAVLAILTGALIVLRLRWPRLSHTAHSRLISGAGAALALYLLMVATGWSTSSNHLNAAIYWAAIASYEFFLLLFTLLRPRWLTTIIAVVLILPILSASSFLPLAELFSTAPHMTASIGPDLISDLAPWGAGPVPSGFDFTVYSHPTWTRFLRRRRQACRYYSGQCDASKASATLRPDGKHILMSCPAAANQQPDTARNLVVKLY